MSNNKPKFEYCGACAGCGETPYLKLLSQLFGNELVIAKALTTMNESIGFTQGGMYEVQVDNPILSAATTLYEADIELSAAIIEVKEGYALTEEDVDDFCYDLPRYKRPRKIIFADVPRNPTGKIEKPKLRKMYGAEGLVDMQNKS